MRASSPRSFRSARALTGSVTADTNAANANCAVGYTITAPRAPSPLSSTPAVNASVVGSAVQSTPSSSGDSVNLASSVDATAQSPSPRLGPLRFADTAVVRSLLADAPNQSKAIHDIDRAGPCRTALFRLQSCVVQSSHAGSGESVPMSTCQREFGYLRNCIMDHQLFYRPTST